MTIVTRTDIENYVKTLENKQVQSIYNQIYDLYISLIEDTLSDEFQIVCELHDVFKKYATRAHVD